VRDKRGQAPGGAFSTAAEGHIRMKLQGFAKPNSIIV
jgi:hypothetical protein